MPHNQVRIVEAGDSALVAEFEPKIDAGINARAVALARSLCTKPIDGLLDVVPAFRTVTVYFDPLITNRESLITAMRDGATETGDGTETAARELIDVPVCYGGELGPDLLEVAQHAGLSETEVVERHTAPVYRVYMLGFMPGFAYMGLVDPAIAVPRRSTPRTHVPPGSVAVAGDLTGVYPSASPGGWRIIGRTLVQPYDVSRSRPCLFQPGDAVRFRPIDRMTYETGMSGAGLS